MNSHILSFIAISVLIQQACGAYIFGYLLHNPIPDENHHLFLSDQSSDSESNETSIVTEIEVRETDDKKKLSDRCSNDKDCVHLYPGNYYCDTHYGYCDTFKKISELCRRDEQCQSGLICIFGRCEIPAEKGSQGSRCNNSSDCNPNHCCARQHGEKICKPMIAKGKKCFVPFGGLDYSLNESCPCEEGLYCTHRKTKSLMSSTGSSNNKRRMRSNLNHLRCMPKDSSTTPAPGSS